MGMGGADAFHTRAGGARIHELAARFSETMVILDHMGRPGQGTRRGICGGAEAGDAAAGDPENIPAGITTKAI